jgi:tetratricopeptide (TPR) repeat protein
MFRNIVILALLPIVGTGLPQGGSSQDDFESTLTRAQALYYEARFKDSVELLLPVDAVLREQPDHVSQRVQVKLQLALGYIGQNQIAQAKSVFKEVCVLDAAYSLDSSQFAPKVLALFNDAKAEQKKDRCEAFCEEIDKYSRSGDVQGLFRLARETPEGCTCEAAAGAAELLYTQGVEAYKREDFGQAIEELRAALKFRPQHELAVQYFELTESKAKLTVEQKSLDWRKHFDAQEFPKAATVYRQLESVNIEGKADSALEQIRGEYRKAVSSRVESWNQSCAAGASLSLDTVRQQLRELLPNEKIAADVVAKFSPCEPVAVTPVEKVEAPVSSTVAAAGCLVMPSQQAMARIKSRTNPEIPIDRIPLETVNLRAKVRIDESGNVSVREVSGASSYLNEAMRVAIERWKFLPATVGDQRRCVETELPVSLRRS